MKNLSALLLCGAICFTPIPAFANEVTDDIEQPSAVYNQYQEYDGWIYGMPIHANTIMPVPCDGTITIGYNTIDSDTIKLLTSDGNALAYINSADTGSRLSVPVKKGTYYLVLSDPFSSFVTAFFEPSEDYTGWAYNGYMYAKSNPDFVPSAKSEIWYYYKNGRYLEGWQYINGSWYYFKTDEIGEIGTSTNGMGDGYMASSEWIYNQDYSKKYYVGESGRMITNSWIKVGTQGNWFYVKADGSAVTNSWFYSKGKWYWLDEDGVMAANEWIEQDGKWYYLRPSGAMAANETICGNKFDSHGVWLGKA